jgi:general secretion pathway protein A
LYLKFFGLSEAPFSITPDPAFVYLSPEHREALAHLLYGVGQGGAGGFVQLTGEVGTGKTTLCRCLLEQLPEQTHVALVLNPLLTPRELLATICDELGIDTKGISDSNKALVDELNAYLLAQHARGHRVVVVIDEAQNLSPEALEQVRLLTNLETPKEKLLQMVLLGQPELRQLLQRQNLRQLSQRITARYHLKPLNQEETRAYVRHRMMVAGAQRSPFSRSALRSLYQRSGGVPRLINIIADRALAGAYARESGQVTSRLIQAAANEVQPSETRVRSNRWPGVLAAAAGLLLVMITVYSWGPAWLGSPLPVAEPAAEAVSAQQAPVPARELAVEQADPLVELQTPATGAVESIPPVVDESLEEPAAAGEALDPAWLDQQHLASWRSLAGLWGNPQNSALIQAACDGAQGTGFACLQESGNWSRIRHLGLPVILVLRDGDERLLLLRGFAGDAVLVGSDEDSRTMARDDIEQKWLGDYLLAWPQAPDWPSEIYRGQSGPAVDIVMQMAAFAEPAWHGGGIFNAGFESWLEDFQRHNGLVADGIIGPITLIHLMAPTISDPRLVMDMEEDE